MCHNGSTYHIYEMWAGFGHCHTSEVTIHLITLLVPVTRCEQASMQNYFLHLDLVIVCTVTWTFLGVLLNFLKLLIS